MATARRSSQRRLAQAPARRVLVVCYGNIYRSAFVGALLRDRLRSVAEVRSGGFHPVADRPAPPRHVQMCQRYGISLAEHRSSVVTAADVAWADLIVLMDRHNWAALHALGANAEKLVWLGGLLAGPVEISDPYALPDSAAERVLERMHDAGERLVQMIATQR